MKKIPLLLGLLLLLATSCIGPFYEKDFGKNIRLPIGTPFEVRLEGDPHSEYEWRLSEIDTNVVRMALRPSFKPFNDDSRPGGVFSFYFQTVGEGKTNIELYYASRKDEPISDDALKSFSMEVESRI